MREAGRLLARQEELYNEVKDYLEFRGARIVVKEDAPLETEEKVKEMHLLAPRIKILDAFGEE